MRPVDFQAVEQLVPLDKVLELIGWHPVRKEGTGRRGPCPVHRSQNPRSRNFAVNADGWFCHTCRRGGHAVELYALVYGMQPLAAAVEMCQRVGEEVPNLPRRPRQPRKARNRKLDR